MSILYQFNNFYSDNIFCEKYITKNKLSGKNVIIQRYKAVQLTSCPRSLASFSFLFFSTFLAYNIKRSHLQNRTLSYQQTFNYSDGQTDEHGAIAYTTRS